MFLHVSVCPPGGSSGGLPAREGYGEPLRDSYCCGRYASYWNAFLLLCNIPCFPFCCSLVLNNNLPCRYYRPQTKLLEGKGGFSSHLNHLIAYQLANYDWPFGTLPFGFFCQIWTQGAFRYVPVISLPSKAHV